MSRYPLFLGFIILFLCLRPVLAAPAAPTLKDADAAFKKGEAQMTLGTSGGYAESIRDFVVAAQDYQALQNRKQQGNALNSAGLCYERTGQQKKALQFYQQALPLAMAGGDKAAEATTLSNIGQVYDDTGQPEKALQFYQKALSLERAAGDKDGEASTLNGIGAIYGETGQPEKALQFYQQALPFWHAVGDKDGVANTLTNIGYVYETIGQPEKALQFFQQALPLAMAAGDKAEEATILNNTGSVYEGTAQPGKALHFFQRALPLLKAAGDRLGEAAILSNIGIIYRQTGQPEKALGFYRQALPIERAAGNRSGEASILTNIGYVYRVTGQLKKALQFYQLALPLRQAVGDRAGEAATLSNIGAVYEAIGQSEKALQFYQRALPLGHAVGDKVGEARTLGNIGHLYDAIGQPEKALQYDQQALPLERAAGDKADEASTLQNIGYIYGETGQPEKALQFYQQALPLRQASGDKVGEANTLKVEAETLHTLGRNDEARKDYEAALDAADAVIGSIKQNDLKRSTTETFQYLYRSYINFLLQQANHADDRRALEISEKARARALRDLLAGNRSQLPSASLTPPAVSPTTPVLVAAAPTASNAKTTRAVRASALRDALGVVALSTPDLPVSSTAQAKDFQADEAKLSAADGPAILYHPLEKDLAIFVIESSGEIHVIRSPVKPTDLHTLIETAREEITSPGEVDPAETQATLRKLYDALIQPVEPWLPAPASGHTPTISLVPFGSLLQLPFAALVAPDGHYLIENYAIRTSPSLTVLRYTRQRAAALQKTAMRPVLFGDPVMPQGFVPLPGSFAEAQQVSAMLTSDHPVLRVQQDASEANFRTLAPTATEIHLATHGYVDELQPRLSGVILSASSGPEPEYQRDGYLTVTEVFQLKLNARLVTLSACDTGLGPAGADGVFGLQSAFLTAGAASLLSSLWEVSDTATAKLMAEFYHQMETDPAHNRAQALRSAQLSLLGTPGYQQPEYWAAFQLTGEAR